MSTTEKRFRKVLVNYGIRPSKTDNEADYYYDLIPYMLDLMDLAKKITDESMITIPDAEVMKIEKVSVTNDFLEKNTVFIFSAN